MADDDNTQVTFKIPHKLLIYVALAVGGGGTAWNSVSNVLTGERSDRIGRTTYVTLASSLEMALLRLDRCEERLDALEEHKGSGRRYRRSGGSSRDSDSGVDGATPFHTGGDTVRLMSDTGEETPKVVGKVLPTFDDVQRMAVEMVEKAPKAASAKP